MKPIIDENSEFILKDSYNYTFVETKESSVPAYILHQLQNNATIANESVGITNGVTGEKTLYRDFESLSRRVASGLFKKGFGKGDTLIYTTDQVERLHVFLLGAWRANGILRGSYPEDHGEPLLRRIEESRARWILCDDDIVDRILETIESVPWTVHVVVFGNCPKNCIPASTFFDDEGQECPELDLNGEDIAVVMPTSGTTGRSKGVILTHERFLRNFQVTKGLYCQSDPSRVFLHLGKATHVTSALSFGFIAAGQGMVRLPLRGMTHERIFKAIHDYKPYGMNIIAPFMLKLVSDPKISEYALTSLQFIGLMATISGTHLVAAIKASFPGSPAITNIYGSTETLNLCYGMKFSTEARTKIDTWDLPPLATGKLVPGCQLAVVDVESGDVLGPNQNGELWFKSNYSCIGYLNNEKETAASFQNGWIRTGDFGYYDQEGFVYVTSRLKEIFHHFGNQVSPSEIEDVLMRHPLVAEACVIPVEDANGGDMMPKGYVVLKEGVSTGHDEASIDINRFLNSKVPEYKQLKGGLEIKQRFIYGPSGKIQRFLI